MANKLAKYGIPTGVMRFVENGLLEILREDEEHKTIEFHMPSKRWVDAEGRVTSYSLIWIHPDFNGQFCHYYDRIPGDLPNYWLTEDVTDIGAEQVAGLESVTDLVWWLDEFSSACV